MVTMFFIVVVFFTIAYVMKSVYYGIIYLALGCNSNFNRFAKKSKQFIENEWRNDLYKYRYFKLWISTMIFFLLFAAVALATVK